MVGNMFLGHRRLLAENEDDTEVEAESEGATEYPYYYEESTDDAVTEEAPSAAEKFAKKEWERLLTELHKLPSTCDEYFLRCHPS
jgi:hypothetical protein